MIFEASSSFTGRPAYSFTLLMNSVSRMLQAVFTGITSCPLRMATLGAISSPSTRGGTRWMRTTPGPSGFRVVWWTSPKF